MNYKAPLNEIRFVLNDVLNVQQTFAQLPSGAQASTELVDAVLEEAAKFCEQILLPTNAIGDREGCHFDATSKAVTVPEAFKAAYRQYVDGGWMGLCGDPKYGGQGMPETIGYAIKELIESCNVAWGTYPLLSLGAVDAFMHHGEEWQRAAFVPKILAGEWTGTMCLTEPHCGSDLGLLKTKAEPQADGSYKITGTKIFITAGEHDMSANIIHLVLARLPDAPAGTKGISMFIVPKFKVARDGSLGVRNAIAAGSIEHKMGLKGSATCVMNLDGAEGYLIGQANRGLNAMFTMMNTARLGVGVQGLGLIEITFQNALAYAKDRLQMRSLSGPKRPDKPADPLLVHPDIRRMILTQKAIVQAGRALCLYSASLVDCAFTHPDADARKRADELLSFLTPISKGFMTEAAIECTYNGVQVLGGHGYIAEWGQEQFARDARITTIYEGTTQIQALDLLARKVLATQGVGMKHFAAEIQAFLEQHTTRPELAEFIPLFLEASKDWQALTFEIASQAAKDPEQIGAAAVDYLFYSSYVTLAYFWLRLVEAAYRPGGGHSDAFKQAKTVTARFYFHRLLPRRLAHAAAIRTGSASLMGFEAELFDA
jgi:hypothetical protein